MAINNHFHMSNFHKLDSLLRSQAKGPGNHGDNDAYAYARGMAAVEGVVAVVSDLAAGTSRIFSGRFASVLGLPEYSHESSIWEKEILGLMSDDEQEHKFIAELRFFHFLRQQPRSRRQDYCLVTKLRLRDRNGNLVNVLHRMYYIYDSYSGNVRYAICLYGHLHLGFTGKSAVIDNISGIVTELTSAADNKILSARERQILALIDSGMTSADIAVGLCISRHTVNRHRQEILRKLQTRNSLEACRLAKSINLI